MQIVKKDAIKAVCLKLYTRQEVGTEAAITSFSVQCIHTMREIFNENKTKAILFVDTENAFHTIKRKAQLHNTVYVCPELAMFFTTIT